MNNDKPLNQLIEELEPKDYEELVACLKENFGTVNCNNPKHYELLKPILCDYENRAYFNTLSKGCQIAMILYVCMYERQKQLDKEINDIIKGLMAD